MSVLSRLTSSPDRRARIRSALKAVGFDTTDWVRVVMYRRCFEFIRSLGPHELDALEIAAGPQWVRELTFRSYTPTQYPHFDICDDVLDRRFDVIIADQVFEHLKSPRRAAQNVYEMLKLGGHFVITTPFLIRVHESPIDCSRWTETGLSYLLQEAGFLESDIVTESWGNRACVAANFSRWPKYGWGRSLRNEPNFPVMVWAYARKSVQAQPR
ncbi:methyltransferase domain-containing protein [Micromonospora sp. STR1s_5]|nr:methyltransferase domain-containing protein [Micromonospora sp. STR1s_5]